jgi:hypothetical protein
MKMANWKYKLDMAADWQLCKEGAINAQELARRVVKHLRELPLEDDKSDESMIGNSYFPKQELNELIEDFNHLSNDEDATVDDFDEIYDRLCDWGDQEIAPYGKWPTNKLCWIGVF